MKYAVQVNAVLDTKSKSDNLAQVIKDKIAGKMLWANSQNPNSVAFGLSNDGKPAVTAIYRFDSVAERDDVAQYIRGKINQLPALSGTVKTHTCYHDQPELNKPCDRWQEI